MKPDPNCPMCNGTGAKDSGGITPWGSPIYIPCECLNLLAEEHGVNRSGYAPIERASFEDGKHETDSAPQAGCKQ